MDGSPAFATMADMVAPITVHLLAYGQKSNLSKLVKEAVKIIEDWHDQVQEGWIVDREAKEVAETIQAALWDQGHTLLKLSKTHQGIEIRMPDMHERSATEWLRELEMAKTCVVLAEWTGDSDGERHQVVWIRGERWSDSREI